MALFYSYSLADTTLVLELKALLDGQGISGWIDRDLRQGDSRDIAVAVGLRNASIFVGFVSLQYLDSEECNRELQLAAAFRTPILYVLLADITGFPPLPDAAAFAAAMAPHMTGKHWVRAHDQTGLLSAVTQDPATWQAPGGGPLASAAVPPRLSRFRRPVATGTGNATSNSNSSSNATSNAISVSSSNNAVVAIVDVDCTMTVEAILKIMAAHAMNPVACEKACGVLADIAVTEKGRYDCILSGAVRFIAVCLKNHATSEGLCNTACIALRIITTPLRDDQYRLSSTELTVFAYNRNYMDKLKQGSDECLTIGAMPLIRDCLQNHAESPNVCFNTCWALCLVAAASASNKDAVSLSGVPDLAVEVYLRHVGETREKAGELIKTLGLPLPQLPTPPRVRKPDPPLSIHVPAPPDHSRATRMPDPPSHRSCCIS